MKKILYSSLFLSILQSILFWHKSPGISIAIFLTATIILIIYNLKEKEMLKNKKGILWAIPIELLGLTYFIFNNTFFKILNGPVILALFVIMCMNITKTKVTEYKFIRQILSKIFKPFAVLFDFISDFDMDEFFEKQKENKNNKSEYEKTIIIDYISRMFLFFVGQECELCRLCKPVDGNTVYFRTIYW